MFFLAFVKERVLCVFQVIQAVTFYPLVGGHLAIQRVLQYPWRNTSVCYLGGGFKYVFMFTPKFGEDYHFDQYFSKGLKPPTCFI